MSVESSNNRNFVSFVQENKNLILAVSVAIFLAGVILCTQPHMLTIGAGIVCSEFMLGIIALMIFSVKKRNLEIDELNRSIQGYEVQNP